MKIYIRNEIYENEYRSPIVPHDIQVLTNHNYFFYIQESKHRIFSNQEFQECSGVQLTSKEWFDPEFQDCFILGIKELPYLENLHQHTHCYFSHSFKQQANANQILRAFSKSKSILYDIEYLLDKKGNRLIAFGYYAGLTGAVLGLQEYIQYQSLEQLVPWASYEDMVSSIQIPPYFQPKILIIGSKGRCGSGVRSVLNTLHIPYTTMDKGEEKDIHTFDIVFNCILLDTDYTRIWFPKDYTTDQKMVIVDISCDYSKPNHPIPLYSEATTWKKPVYKPSENISIIAIENLPSLLPKESSIHFSKYLTKLLLENDQDIWQSNKNYFLRCLAELGI